MAGKVKSLHPRKAQFLRLLLEGKSYTQAAKEVGISEATLWRWKADPLVKAKLEEAQRERFEAAQLRVALSLDAAIEALQEVCRNSRSTYARVRAAQVLLDVALKLKETFELEKRLEAIERKLEELEGGHVKGKVEIA